MNSNTIKILFAGILLLLSICNLKAQKSDSLKFPAIEISGFADVFYAYDFNKPKSENRQTFFYNHNRHNQPNLNLGYIKLALTHPKVRANFAIQTGTYVLENYAAEPGFLKHIFEANAGVSLNRKNTLWMDAGVFASHIGFESAVSVDNWTLTRSILAENSPYFLAGGKITYNHQNKLEVAAVICNGWQRIKPVSGKKLPGFGTQLKLTPKENIIINWSTFAGADDPDSMRRIRFFNNLYGQFQLHPKFGLIAGFDIGIQQRAKESKVFSYWLSPVMILRYSISKKFSAALRGEYYFDPSEVIVTIENVNGFRTSGLSLNFDYNPIKNVALRIEGRWLNNQDIIFTTQKGNSANNVFIVISAAAKFDKDMFVK